jgi:ribosomal protein S18 acetylase RimI-like enzyme
MTDYKFIKTTDREYIEERYLRAKVLREPLGLPKGCEVFPFEKEAYHLVAIDQNKVVGCVMFNPEGKSGRLLQMAVFEEYQGKGVGTTLVKKLEEYLAKKGFENIYLHARFDAVPFYERLGYKVEGDEFEEVGIRHFNMVKRVRYPLVQQIEIIR